MKRLVCKILRFTDKLQKKKIILFVTLVIISINVYAQTLIPGANSANTGMQNMDVPTPTVASLGKYGETPVSYYTGEPKISVPLYDLKTRDVSMPITLDYDAKGVMVNNLPGWAGQNWTLNIGGVITRSRHGAIDEKELSDYQVEHGGVLNNYFKSHKKIKEVATDASNNYSKLKETLMFTGGEWDMAPDIFTFHFLNKSGKFFLDNDGEWKVIGDDNLDIIFDYNDENNYSLPIFERLPSLSFRGYQKKTISGFVIRDEEGNTYRFGYDKNATEYTTNIWRMSEEEHDESWYANSWYLTNVKDKFGNTLLSFNYERGAYIIQMFNYFVFHEYKKKWNGLERIIGPYISDDFPYTMTISSPVYLKKVTGNGTTINLHSSYVSDEMATENLYDNFYHYYSTSKEHINWSGFYYMFLRNRIKYFSDNNYCYMGNFFYIQGYRSSIPSGFSSNLKVEYEKMLNTIKMCRYNRDYTDDPDKMDILRYSRLKQLDSITISGNGGTKGIVFQHSYINKRLCLKGLLLTGKAQNMVGNYKFSYNNFNQLPDDYLTTAVDYWGRYNGKGYKISDIFGVYTASWGGFLNSATVTMSYVNTEAVDCSPTPEYAQIGILTEIQYPTGGTTCLNTRAMIMEPVCHTIVRH